MILVELERIKPFDFDGLQIRDFIPGLLDSVSVAFIEVPPGVAHPKAKSTRSDKIYFCIEGRVQFKSEGKGFELKPKSLLVIGKLEWFEYSNKGCSSASLLLLHIPSFDLNSEVFAK